MEGLRREGSFRYLVPSQTITVDGTNVPNPAYPPWRRQDRLLYSALIGVKGTKTISEYLRIIKGKADDLALLGKPIDPEDLTEQILAGLSDDYKPEIDDVNADIPLSPFLSFMKGYLSEKQ
ncbi:unnamed protein product [Microthlaspi erraticum]|uniref:Uncharacterized protein n=1 Tax=Microthlaspi erraticum TaxID=1685480 RepID=A0A6D2HGQ6_9BRAS|nr:unnamed protein product [Microthlaspi erraticum]